MKRADIKRAGSGQRGGPGAPLELHALAKTEAGRSVISQRPVADPIVLSAKLDPTNLPEPPDDMPEEGVGLWHDVMPWLVQMNVLQALDLPSFTQMCRVFAQAEVARRVLDEQGFFTLGSGGQMVEHPAMKILQTSQMMFLRHAGEFGMTTMARTRLGLLEASRKSIQQDLDWTLGPSTRRTEADVEATG